MRHTGSSRVRRIASKMNRRRLRYVRGSMGKTVRLGRVGPGGEYAGIHVGAQLRSRGRRTEYYVGVSAGRKILQQVVRPVNASVNAGILERSRRLEAGHVGTGLGDLTRAG